MISTPSVVRRTTQEDVLSEQKLDQQMRLVSVPRHQVQGVNVLDQGVTKITTENIGTPDYDYIRYKSIETAQKTTSGNSFDFTSVLNIWGKTEPNTDTVNNAQLYGQSIFGVLPIANLTGTDRSKLLQQMRTDQVFQVNYTTVKHEQRGNRPTYTYDVTVAPVPYVSMLKTFADILGLKQLEQVNPSDYQNTPDLKFKFVVDVWSSQLVEITYTDDSARTEVFGSYGVHTPISEPTETIPVSELQQRLQQLQ